MQTERPVKSRHPHALSPAPYVAGIAAETSALLVWDALLEKTDRVLHLPASESQPNGRLEIHCATRTEAEAMRQRLVRLAATCRTGGAGQPWVRRVPRRDWAESWKRHFRVRRVSPRVVIKPTWIAHRGRPGDCVVTLDPGLSFGTGQHGTTRACLRLLDALQRRVPEASVLDLGCGSGILAIAAAKLGFPRVCAVDHDADAIRIARDNAALNGVAARIEFAALDIERGRPSDRYDIVLANLLAGLLTRRAARVAGCVRLRPPGYLVLSGILNSQYAEVRRAYAALGWRVWRSVTAGEWVTGCLRPQYAFENSRTRYGGIGSTLCASDW